MQALRLSHTASRTSRTRSTAIAAGLCALIAAAAAQPSTGAAAGGTKRVVAEAFSPALGRTVLTNLRRRTLYSLSVEKRGHFICTGSCLRVWHPLVVRAGVRPTGPVRLRTVKRPDGRTQVTFRGRPLYSFSGDSKKGEANGEGFKDVGTWHAASPGRSSQPAGYPESTYPSPTSSPTPETQPTPEYPYPGY